MPTQTEYYRNRLYTDPEFKERHYRHVRERTARMRKAIALLVSEFRKKGCLVCEEMEPCCLEAHHTNPDNKEFNIASSASAGYSLKRVRSELEKCVCLCRNCHTKVHAEVLSLGGYV